MKIDMTLTAQDLKPFLIQLYHLSESKITRIDHTWDVSKGTPVFTVEGKYSSRGWTEWTQGFMYGWPILLFEVTGEKAFLGMGKKGTVEYMAPHLTHMGVHDHGFNNVSTYGNLRRLMLEGKIIHNEWEMSFYELALKVSGAVQARRWTDTADGDGFIYSFNGPHSLFIDTIRTLRSLAVAHQLGHVLMEEGDRKVSLLERIIKHARVSAKFNVFYGECRDYYDIRGRVVHEAIFNIHNGIYRSPSTQQGYSPFSTWTRGLAWAILGYVEQLEFMLTVDDKELVQFGGRNGIESMMLKAAQATAEFYMEHSALDGIPYWDTGAPNLEKLGDWRSKPSDPYNAYEPVDSSAAAIAAQGLLRLGQFLQMRGDDHGKTYIQAGLTVARSVFTEPYLSIDKEHQGLILHSVYHRPNDWDYKPGSAKVPYGESSMWGDYHGMELAVYIQKLINKV